MTCEELETDDGDDGPTAGHGKGLKKRPAVALDTPLQDLKSLMPSAEGARVRAARFEDFMSTHLAGKAAFEGQVLLLEGQAPHPYIFCWAERYL